MEILKNSINLFFYVKEKLQRTKNSQNYKVYVILHNMISLLSSISMVISAGIYLFHIETDEECIDLNNKKVHRHFTTVIAILFTIGIFDFLRNLSVFVAIITGKHELAGLHTWLGFIELLEIVHMILVH